MAALLSLYLRELIDLTYQDDLIANGRGKTWWILWYSSIRDRQDVPVSPTVALM